MSASVLALISVYNGEAYLAESIESVLSELAASDRLIVVDDGSTDGTAEVLTGFGSRIDVMSQANAGVATAFNRALATASEDYVAFNDADDLWTPGRLNRMRGVLDADPAVAGVTGMVEQFASGELSETASAELSVPQSAMRGATFPSLLLRRSVLVESGPFNETMPQTFGYDWLAGFHAKQLRLHVLPDIVLRRRLHESNWSRLNREQLKSDSLRALRAQVLRRRG